jgi:simple sugar transport system permease protein
VLGVGGSATLVLVVVLAAGGFPIGPSLAALWRGAAGSGDAFLSATLVRAIPLMLLGSGIVIAMRAGVINLGGDGQFLAGAIAATATLLGLGVQGPVAMTGALALAAVGGGAWAALPAWLKARFGTLEVVSTIMMNFVAAFLVSYLVRGPMQEPTAVYPQSSALGVSNHLPIIVPGSRLHLGIGFAVIAVVASWLLVEQTAAGFRIRAVGSNPRAAALAGRIDVRRVQSGVFLVSGALAGIAGGVEVLGVTYALYENLSPGYGYTAIAVALLARLAPLQVAWSALLLGGLAAGATAMQRDAGIPAGAAAVVEATLILAVLGGQAFVLRWAAHSAEGRTT